MCVRDDGGRWVVDDDDDEGDMYEYKLCGVNDAPPPPRSIFAHGTDRCRCSAFIVPPSLLHDTPSH
jgi:hypothetical protein